MTTSGLDNPMTTIERCARAMWDAMDSARMEQDREAWDDANSAGDLVQKQLLMDLSRAVLEVLREPDEGMVEAGDRAGEMEAYPKYGAGDEAEFSVGGSKNVLIAMIDAASK